MFHKIKLIWSQQSNVRKTVFTFAIILAVSAFQYYSELRDRPGRANVSGYILQSEGRLDEAIAQYDIAIKAKPEWYHPYVGRGSAYALKGDYGRAIADLERSVVLNPEHPEAYYERGLVLRQTGETERALDDLARATRLKPELGEAYFARAMILRDRKQYRGAAAELEAAIKARPDKADYHIEKGRILLLRLNEPARAADAFAAGLRAAFGYRSFRKLLDYAPGSSGQAGEEMMDNRHSFVPDVYYVLLWTHVARVRAGQDDYKELADLVHELAEPTYRELLLRDLPASTSNLPKLAQDKILAPWPGPVIALFLGSVSPISVRALSETATDDSERHRRRCDADFYLAIHAVQNGEPAQARTLLLSSAEDCMPDRLEALMARSELQFLSKSKL